MTDEIVEKLAKAGLNKDQKGTELAGVPARMRQIAKRLHAHGKPVRHTTTGFELERGVFLARMNEMSGLRTLGLVEKVGNDLYALTQAGKELAEAEQEKPEEEQRQTSPGCIPPMKG